MSEIWIELLGWGGLLCAIAAFQAKGPRNVIAMQAPGCALSSIHFWFKGGIVGALFCVLATIRNIASVTLPEKTFKIFMSCLGLVILIVSYYTVKTPTDLISVAAFCLSSTACLMRDNGFMVRMLYVASCSCWLIYSILVGSLPLAIMEAMLLSSALIGAIRHEKEFQFLRETTNYRQIQTIASIVIKIRNIPHAQAAK